MGKAYPLTVEDEPRGPGCTAVDQAADRRGEGMVERDGTLQWLERYWLTWTLVFGVAGLCLMTAHALTKIPHSDEGDLASAGVSVLQRGKIAFSMSYDYVASVRDEIGRASCRE